LTQNILFYLENVIHVFVFEEQIPELGIGCSCLTTSDSILELFSYIHCVVCLATSS